MKSRSFYRWLFAVISLLILLGISVYLGVSGWYFTNEISQKSNLTLGNNVLIEVGKNQSASCSFSFSGGYLPGEKLAQIVSVKNASEEAVFLRAKIYVFMSERGQLSLVTSPNWFLNEDDYYYFTDSVLGQSKISLCSKISLDANFSSEKSYIMTIAVESLDSQLDVEKIWGIDPSDFKAKILLQEEEVLLQEEESLLPEDRESAKSDSEGQNLLTF